MQINDPAHPVSFMPLINVKLIQAEKEIVLIFGKSFGLWLLRTLCCNTVPSPQYYSFM